MFSFLSDRLIRNQLDFEYVDECQIEDGTASETGLTFPNCEGEYPVVIIPAMKVMGLDTARKLKAFVRSGGLLIALEELPVHSTFVANDPELAKEIDSLFPNTVSEGGWHSYGDGRTLFMTSEQLSGDDAAGLCEELRRRLDDGDPGKPWIVPPSSAEQVVITGKRMADRLFTWILNWSALPVRIQYRSPSGDGLQEWELETGGIRPLSEQELLQFELAPGQLRIVAQTFEEASQEPASEYRVSRVRTIELSPEWSFEPEDANALILDCWEVTMNDRQARMPVRMPGQVNAFRKTIQVRDEWIEAQAGIDRGQTEPGERKRGVYLVLDDLKQEIQSHIGFLSRRRSVEIFVNGERLPALEPAQWQDRFYQWAEISALLRGGDNTIEILIFSLLEPMPNFAFPAFLTGDFSVTDDGALTGPVARLSGYWTDGGYPYLSGKGVYSQTFEWQPEPAAEESGGQEISVELEIEEVRETARLRVNGQDAGVRLWPPYHWDVTPWMVPGTNRIELQVANTLDNIYGKRVIPSGIGGQARLTVRSTSLGVLQQKQ